MAFFSIAQRRLVVSAVLGMNLFLVISWLSSSCGTPHSALPQALPSTSFWDSFGKTEVYVLTIPLTLNRWRHLRDVISTGPWPATLIEGCTPQTPVVAEALVGRDLQEKAVALVCSHYRAIEDAKKKDLDFALILEDDAQFINDFWRRLELRLKRLPKFGVFYLQHSSNEHILRIDKRNVLYENRRPIARKFVAQEVYALGAGAFDGLVATIWDAGGYMLSRDGINSIMQGTLPQWLRRSRSSFKIYSSEMLLSHAAEGHGAFFAIPALIYQCTSKTSLIQSGSKAETDRLGRHKQKNMFSAILKQGLEAPIPEWLLECGFDSAPPPNKTVSAAPK